MRALLLLVLAATLAGCLGPLGAGSPVEPQEGAGVEPVLAGDAPFRWAGRRLAGEELPFGSLVRLAACAQEACPNAPASCEAAACERVPFEVRGAEPDGAALVLSVRWRKVPGLAFDARIEDASGNVVALGRSVYADSTGVVARVEDAPPGRYHAVVVAVAGEGAYEAAVRLEAKRPSAPSRELLPNLVTLPPTDLGLVAPGPVTLGPFVLGPPEVSRVASGVTGAQGCTLDETLSRQPGRCLRFSNVVGNVGEGVLDVRLSPADGATSAVGGSFVQRVYTSDGSFTETRAGAAEWHVTHAHWHNAASNRYSVYEHDLATGARGARVNDGHKAGVCFADTGIVDVGMPRMDLPRYNGFSCWNPADERTWTMGLSVGWYDIYDWPLADQYVDIGGAPDGVYELCSVTNPEGGLRESDLSDNEGCTLFRLAGDTLEVLSAEPYHAERG